MTTKNTGMTGTTVTKTSELLITTRNELGALARITTPLSKNNINVNSFSGYEWGTEVAIRLITDNNKKAIDLLRNEGFNVTENTVALWQTENTPGRLTNASTSLAESRVNTHASYATTDMNTNTTTVVFNTDNVDRTIDVLKRIG